jgi:preprotein translocase subunit YajC
MQRKIFSIERILKVRINLSKLVTLISLAFGTACMQIMLSPIIAHADRPRSEIEAENIQGAYLTLIFSFFVLVVVFIFAIWKQQANEIDKQRSRTELKRLDKEIAELEAALTPEELHDSRRRSEESQRRIDARVAEDDRKRQEEKQHKEHQEFLRNMEKERITRENKIRDFRNRYGRDPNSWEI